MQVIVILYVISALSSGDLNREQIGPYQTMQECQQRAALIESGALLVCDEQTIVE